MCAGKECDPPFPTNPLQPVSQDQRQAWRHQQYPRTRNQVLLFTVRGFKYDEEITLNSD